MPAYDDIVNPRPRQQLPPQPWPPFTVNLYVNQLVMMPTPSPPQRPARFGRRGNRNPIAPVESVAERAPTADEQFNDVNERTRVKTRDAYAKQHFQEIHKDWLKKANSKRSEEIWRKLLGVRLRLDEHGIWVAEKDSAQNPYIQLYRRLRKGETVEPELAEAVRLMSAQHEFGKEMVDHIEKAGWDPAKICLPLPEDKRKANKSAAKKAKSDKQEEPSDDVQEGDAGEDDEDSENLNDILVDLTSVTHDVNDAVYAYRMDVGNLSKVVRENSKAINKLIEGFNKMATDVVDLTNDEQVDDEDQPLAARREDILAKLDKLTGKVDAMKLSGDDDRLPPLQGGMVSLQADVVGKVVPGLGQLESTVSEQGKAIAGLQNSMQQLSQQFQQMQQRGGQSTAATAERHTSPMPAPSAQRPGSRQNQPGFLTALPAPGGNDPSANNNIINNNPAPAGAGAQSTVPTPPPGQPPAHQSTGAQLQHQHHQPSPYHGQQAYTFGGPPPQYTQEQPGGGFQPFHSGMPPPYTPGPGNGWMTPRQHGQQQQQPPQPTWPAPQQFGTMGYPPGGGYGGGHQPTS